jgi:acyl-CoA synthetase (AMP-forming)/AMP-acid ligase II
MGNPAKVVESRIIRITLKAVPTINNWSDFTLDQGEVGELIVTGDHVCKDYFNNPEAVAQNKITDKDGKIWHRMGDTGYMDEEGRFWLVGRVHSTISRNGEMLHAQNVEQRIQDGLKTPLRVAALGLQDAALGEKLVLVVEQVGKGQAELIEEIKESAETSRIPVDEIKIIKKKIPVDPRHNSKTDYSKLRRMIQDGRS